MRRVRTDNQLAAIPSGGLIEICQDLKNSDNASEQFIAVTAFATSTAAANAAAAIDEYVAGGVTEAVTATADGLTTGLITADAVNVEITSDTATKQVSLPAAVDGKVIRLHCPSTGCEVISAVAADKLNNVVIGATNEAALVAGTVYTLRYVESTGNWVMTGLTALGAVETPVVPDAA